MDKETRTRLDGVRVLHTCGHYEENVPLSKEKYESGRPCYFCREKASWERNKSGEQEELKGSPRQVYLAMVVRDKVSKLFDECILKARQENKDAIKEIKQSVLYWWKAEEFIKHWNDFNDLQSLANWIYKNYKSKLK
jgi:hypothetical protein